MFVSYSSHETILQQFAYAHFDLLQKATYIELPVDQLLDPEEGD